MSFLPTVMAVTVPEMALLLFVLSTTTLAMQLPSPTSLAGVFFGAFYSKSCWNTTGRIALYYRLITLNPEGKHPSTHGSWRQSV